MLSLVLLVILESVSSHSLNSSLPTREGWWESAVPPLPIGVPFSPADCKDCTCMFVGAEILCMDHALDYVVFRYLIGQGFWLERGNISPIALIEISDCLREEFARVMRGPYASRLVPSKESLYCVHTVTD